MVPVKEPLGNLFLMRLRIFVVSVLGKKSSSVLTVFSRVELELSVIFLSMILGGGVSAMSLIPAVQSFFQRPQVMP